MPTSRRARLLWLCVMCAALVVAGLVWTAQRNPTGRVVAQSATRGWKTIQYQGIRVDVPTAWARVDMGGCEFQFERWAPADSPTCGSGDGVAFYASATFDPGHGPGIRHAHTTREPTWGGWIDIGDYDVYAADDDHDVVGQILRSAR